MTDEERWQIIDESWKLVRENERGIKRLDKRLARYIAEGRKRSQEWAEEERIRAQQFEKYKEEALKRAQEWAEEDRQRKKEIDAAFKEMSREVGGIGHGNGAFAEEYFINSLKKSMTFGGIHFDEIYPHVSPMRNKIRDEFDIILANDSVAALIEVKYQVQRDFLSTLTTRKVSNFRMLLPDYAEHQIFLGIGSMSFTDDVIVAAKGLGIGILKQTGETIEYDTENLKAY
ncbi:MAG: DUF4670 domain-containing protein [Planctomycetaceae bacterium]|jgi:hypothetical protein|nr:DUF4670 domain-containing protein [Planctomycetaceae bacterium]